ncbi:hypothetical protein BC943DRAFT_330081 [Umbelopsis sp. AD052]|nr:hypothetical protein BC943DRAFT_330081 [Umbelopsis sp. AD052]
MLRNKLSSLHKSVILRPIRQNSSMNRPAPLPLGDKKKQQEMLDLIRKKQAEMESSSSEMHPDTYKKPEPEFEGSVNPKTGEVNGPKNEPLKHGDWSFGGRVTDF